MLVILLLAAPLGILAACGNCYTEIPLFYNGSVSRGAFGEVCDFWNFTDGNLDIATSHNFCRIWPPERSAWCYTGGLKQLTYCDTGSFECPLCINSPAERDPKPIISIPCRLPPTPRLDPRVVGGLNITNYRFPWLAGISIDPQDNAAPCHGSLIHPNYILTAAHCLVGVPNRTGTVVLGLFAAQGNDPEPCRTITEFFEKDVFCHPEYNPNTKANDVCLIRLKTASKYTPIRLYHDEIETLVGENLEADALTLNVIGYGVQADGVLDGLAHRASVPIVSNCLALNYDPSTMICAGYVNGGHGPCYIDDGSSLFTHRKGVYWLIGVVGVIPQACTLPNTPDVYARVNTVSFRHWVCGTHSPTRSPTSRPSKKPTLLPTVRPTKVPTLRPTLRPTKSPTVRPSRRPTKSPTRTRSPTLAPTLRPTKIPTLRPTKRPTSNPTTKSPTKSPSTRSPTTRPTTSRPTKFPTDRPSKKPTASPASRSPTPRPSTKTPTFRPSKRPTGSPVSRSPTPHPTTRYPTSVVRTLCTYLFRNTL